MKFKGFVFLAFSAVFLSGCMTGKENQKLTVAGVDNPVISLNGVWKFSIDPPEKFWQKGLDTSDWADIKVPGECQMQGFPIKADTPFAYRQSFEVPEDFSGKKISLDFHGVYSYARVWVNGEFLREHFGGFTKWSCDITDLAEPGQTAELAVEVVDRSDDISGASDYAKHNIGGILRDVELSAVPVQHFEKLHIETELDEKYKDGKLKINYSLSRSEPSDVLFRLLDDHGQVIKKEKLAEAQKQGTVLMDIQSPRKWNSESPYLYTLSAEIAEGGRVLYRCPEKVGFREVEVRGEKLYVNGDEVRLRGANRHDLHPELGRCATAKYDKLDALLAKQANMNFIRTSHYPPTERFLDYCDRYGIYVEDESAICFQYKGTSQNKDKFTSRYLSQLKEMVNNHRNHPSVIIWSVGNESTYGKNFQKSYDWIKANDKTRPVMFSFPNTVPDKKKVYDILSLHYPKWHGNDKVQGFPIKDFDRSGMPVIYDEWAHVACYCTDSLRVEPNIRAFWERSLDKMYANLLKSGSGAGGAIWGMIDETFFLPEGLPGRGEIWDNQGKNGSTEARGPAIGYGGWGIVDPWRRKKPEFWRTKKAYSPVKILEKQVDEFTSGEQLKLKVHNRFNHTSLSEVAAEWQYMGKSGFAFSDIDAGEEGLLSLPALNWQGGTELSVKFFKDRRLLDRYNIRIGEQGSKLPAIKEDGKITLQRSSSQTRARGENFELVLDKEDGLIKDIKIGGELVIKSGPHLNIKIFEKLGWNSPIKALAGKKWEVESSSCSVKKGVFLADIKGSAGKISAEFKFRINAAGVAEIECKATGLPEGKHIKEAGFKFITADAEKVSWDREGYFTAYPENDLSPQKGSADLSYAPEMKYREKPEHLWVYDTQDFFYFGTDKRFPLSRLARGLKENIYRYSVFYEGGGRLDVLSDANLGCRYKREAGKDTLIINSIWDCPDLQWGNYAKFIKTKSSFSAKAVIELKQDL
ncbi:glycoside hydrolase family 2 protein [Sedimentisphaera salicampi]|uniref:glycoside hydrolase family 2 protein n=1 Tax=Sedimentisphaera salicampi TaxID=1941349 RepID=UPI000B9A6082|nr:glycoside hydrolase family 2 TIM barrel-domain containing protein [Sedimentisphaera salicampi]OXU15426.1 Evolved beta-galactosidase subunit alpha [Sedimentisphaera salicampi]